MARVITYSELERMRASVAPISSTERARLGRKEELKKLSEDRIQHWPNTLDANRTKKESFMKDREAKDELRRQEIDKQEAEIRRQARIESITRANTLLYEQTDRMKQLKSQKLYSDVIHNRQQQIRDKDVVREEEKAYEAVQHQNVLEQIKNGASAEVIKQMKMEEKSKLVAVARKQQLEEVLAKREDEKRERIAIGLAMREKGEVLLAEEVRQQEIKRQRAHDNKLQVLKASDKIQTMRIELAHEEKQAEDSRDADVRKVEDRKLAIKGISQMHHDRIQHKRQIIIDAASKNLAEKTNNDNEILHKQETQIKDREEKEMYDKEEKRKKEWNSIVSIRNDQLAYKQEVALAKQDEDERLAILWRDANIAAIGKDRKQAEKSRERMKEIKAIQLGDSLHAQRKKVDKKLLEIEGDRVLQMAESDVDAKFIAACKAEIRKYAAAGKPLHPLLVALHHKTPDLQFAKLVKQETTVVPK